MPRRLLILAAVTIAVGCDSGASGTATVLGTWSGTAVIDNQYATSAVGQTILDPSRPGESALSVSGDDAETLRYVDHHVLAPDTSWSVSSESRLAPSTSMRANAWLSPGLVEVTLRRGGTDRQYSAETPTAAFRWDGARLSLPAPLALAHPDGGSVTLAGSVVPATQSLAAGQEASVRLIERPWSTQRPPTTYDFRPDGTLRRTVVQSGTSAVVTFDDTWERIGDSPAGGERIRLTHREAGSTTVTSTEWRAERVGDALRLTVETYPCAVYTSACLDEHERWFGMAPGTLTSVRQTQTLVLAPATPG